MNYNASEQLQLIKPLGTMKWALLAYKSSVVLHLLFWWWVFCCPSCKRIHSITGISDGWLSTWLTEGQKFTLFQHLEAFHTFSVSVGLKVCFLRRDSDEFNWVKMSFAYLASPDNEARETLGELHNSNNRHASSSLHNNHPARDLICKHWWKIESQDCGCCEFMKEFVTGCRMQNRQQQRSF